MRIRFITVLSFVLAALLVARAGLPTLKDRPSTYALPPAAESPLGRAVLPAVQQHPGGLTGVVPIVDGRVAFGMSAAQRGARACGCCSTT